MMDRKCLLRRKDFIFAVVFCISMSSQGADTLIWTQENSGVKQDLWSVYFTDTLHGWAAGNRATIVRTVNGGATWSSGTLAGTDSIYAIVFQDPATGWMGSNHGTIYATTDSGKTWTTQFSQTRTYMESAWIFGPGTVMFAGGANSRGAFFRTVNGGQLWTPTTISSPSGIGDICFVGPSRGWATGMNLVTGTVDSGKTWGTPVSPVGSYKVYISELWFIDSLKGFGVGRYGGITTTADGGVTWSAVDTSYGAWLEDVAFSDPVHGVTVGERGVITWSSDSGKTWRRTYPRHQPTLDAPWFRSVFCRDAQHWWAAGDSGVIMKGAFVNSTAASGRKVGLPRTAASALNVVKFTGRGPLRLRGNYAGRHAWEVFRLDGSSAGRPQVEEKNGMYSVSLPERMTAGVHLLVIR
jgi:photosystem II stability/assembly factor-like uncharacterized protein